MSRKIGKTEQVTYCYTGQEYIQSESFSADGVQVWQRDQIIIVEILAAILPLSSSDLFAELVLNILVLSQQIKSTGEGT